jgi:hypothetical protein
MNEVIEAMAQADPRACEVFIERQSRGAIDTMIDGLDTLDERVRKAQMARPAELMAYKFPDSHEPLPANVTQTVLEATVMQDSKGLDDVLASLSFDNLATIGSLAYFLKDSAQRQRVQAGHASSDHEKTL